MTIKDFMTHHHRSCDALFATLEGAVEKRDFQEASKACEAFITETLKHFAMEESYLFELFEEKSGMGAFGPTAVMRMEHEQMRTLFERLKGALQAEDRDTFFGLSDSLMILLQQHNAKEEQMLYTMMQSTLGVNNDAIVAHLMEFEH
jgi:hemerythrin-like domain-containing protein